MARYVIALDQGTTSSRAIIFNEHAQLVAAHGIEFTQHYPKPSWVEHEPGDILRTQIEALQAVVAKAGIDASDIAAIGITNQRETTIVWDEEGKPVYRAIVWQCRRSAPMVEQLKEQGLTQVIQEKTGLIPDAYFSGTKIRWILDNVPGARFKAEHGRLFFGTVDSFLCRHLTKEEVHITDPSNASRTMLYNIHTMQWDEQLLAMLDIPSSMLPDVKDNVGIIGHLKKEILGCEIPIAALAGDQQAALFGQGCFAPGTIKNTYGTGCFLLLQTGKVPYISHNNLLTTIAWRYNGRISYALEGSVFVAGAAVQWLRDEMKLIDHAAQSEEIALSLPDSGGVYLVPAFAGLGAPYWDMYGRGTIVGLTRGTGRAHIVRAALEAIAYQVRDVMEAMRIDTAMELTELRVDGGASQNAFLLQYQADILGMRVLRPRIIETTALGVALMAGIGIGLWKDQAQIATLIEADCEFVPEMPQETRGKIYAQWQRAVLRAKGWAREDDVN